MLLIFDLDDTLIDTSGSITWSRLERALREMIEAGLQVTNKKQALDLLRQIDKTSPSGVVTLETFVKMLGGEKKHLSTALKELYDANLDDVEVVSLEGAVDLLEELGKGSPLALVTIGNEKMQREKLKQARIPAELFTSIAFCKEGEKGGIYSQLIKKWQVDPSEVLVIGDRIDRDLSPAKKLGCQTVHLKHGRGLNSEGSSKDVDFEAIDLHSVKGIVEQIQRVSFL